MGGRGSLGDGVRLTRSAGLHFWTPTPAPPPPGSDRDISRFVFLADRAAILQGLAVTLPHRE